MPNNFEKELKEEKVKIFFKQWEEFLIKVMGVKIVSEILKVF